MLLLKHHQLVRRDSAAGTSYSCACTPQAWRRTPEDYNAHVARLVCEKLTDYLDRQAHILEVDADRAAGLICPATSSVGSLCSLPVGHDGLRHISVYGSAWDDNSNQDTADYIQKFIEGTRD